MGTGLTAFVGYLQTAEEIQATLEATASRLTWASLRCRAGLPRLSLEDHLQFQTPSEMLLRMVTVPGSVSLHAETPRSDSLRELLRPRCHNRSRSHYPAA